MLEFYDYSHFTDESKHCEQCAKHDMVLLFAILTEFVSITDDNIISKTCDFADEIRFDLRRVRKKIKNGKNRSLQISGEKFYSLISHGHNLYSNFEYRVCTFNNHAIHFNFKICYTYSIIGQKINKKSVADLVAASPSDNCEICYDPLNDAKTVSVSSFCKHIFCGKCLFDWQYTSIDSNE